MLGLNKNSDGYYILVTAPTASMTLDTSASTYAPGCICINTGDGKTYTNSGTTASPSWQNVNDITTAEISDAAVTPAKTNIVQAVVASPAGTGTNCTISDTATYITASSGAADANSWIILPTPTPGRAIDILVGATGLELRSTSPTTVGINGGTAANAESALTAGSLNHLLCTTSGNWMGYSYTSAGTAAVLQVAAA